MRSILLIAAMLLGVSCQAADGITPGVAFKLPFTVDAQPVVNRATFTLATDGSGSLVVLFVKGDSIETVEYQVIRKGKPDPKPEPKPDPPSELWGIVIEESGDRTPEQAAVLTSPEVRSLFPEGRFQVFDPVGQDGAPVTPPGDLAPYVERAAAKPQAWPMLFLVSPDGDVYYEDSLPGTVAAMKAEVAKHKEAHK